MPFSENVSGIIDDIELQRTYDKAILKHRFLDEITYYEKKRDETKKFYNIFRFIVTTGSILLPAVLSMGQMDPAKLPRNFDMISYWCSWTISLLVTGSNGFLQLFSLDKISVSSEFGSSNSLLEKSSSSSGKGYSSLSLASSSALAACSAAKRSSASLWSASSSSLWAISSATSESSVS